MHHRLVTVSTDKVFPKLARWLIRKFPIYLLALRCEALRDSTQRALIRKGNLPVAARPCQDRLSRFPNQFHLPPASAGQQEFLRRQKIIPSSVQKTTQVSTPLPVKHLNRNCKKFELRKQIQNHGGFPPAASYCSILLEIWSPHRWEEWNTNQKHKTMMDMKPSGKEIEYHCFALSLVGWKNGSIQTRWWWWSQIDIELEEKDSKLRSTIQTYEGSIERIAFQ